MALGIELQRADHGSTYRTAEGDTRANLTGIKLQVENIQETANKDITITPVIADPDNPFLVDFGMGTDTFTMKGTITNDDANSVNAVYIKDDVRYATQFWYSSGIITLSWVDEGDTGVTNTYTGYIQRFVVRYTGGNLNQFPFSLVFVGGKIT